MQGVNIAYTSEYQEHRKRFDYLFSDRYLCNDIERRNLADGKHVLITLYYCDDTHEVFEYNVYASKTEVIDSNGDKVAEFTNIDHHLT